MDSTRMTPGGVRFFTPVQTGQGAHPTASATGTGTLTGIEWPGLGIN
jgi:hypothetical protein